MLDLSLLVDVLLLGLLCCRLDLEAAFASAHTIEASSKSSGMLVVLDLKSLPGTGVLVS